MESYDEMFNSKCPYCGYLCDSATNTVENARKPREGDLTICIKCGEISKFGKNYEILKMTQEDHIEYLLIDPEMYNHTLKVQEVVKSVINGRN